MIKSCVVRGACCVQRVRDTTSGFVKAVHAPRTTHHALAIVCLVLGAGCTSSNITEPGPGAGGRVYFASDRENNNFEIYSISGDGRALRRLTNDNQHNDRAPVASGDGRLIAWVREVAGAGGSVATTEIWVMNSDGSGPKVVVQNGSFNQNPSWTADAGGLVFASFVTGNWEIFRIPVSAGTATNLSNNEFADQNPRVSPDGSKIVFHSNRDLNFEIYVMNLDGGAPTNLSNSGNDDRFPNWLPDGTGIIWSRFIETFDLFVMASDGSSQRSVLASGFNENNASVSPDGKSVVFETNRLGGSTALFTVPVAGGEAVPLTGRGGAAAGSEIEPWWSN